MEFTDGAGCKKDLRVALTQNTSEQVIVIAAEGEPPIRCAAEELYACVIETPWD